MGRDVVALRIDKKSNTVNDKSNGTIHVAPKAVPEKSGKKDYDDCNEKQDVLGVKSTNHQPEEKIIKADAQMSPDLKSTSKAKPASGSATNGMSDAEPFEPLTPSVNHANGDESNDSGAEVLPKSHDLHSPISAKKSQVSVFL